MSTSPEKPTTPLISRKSAMRKNTDSPPYGHEADIPDHVQIIYAFLLKAYPNAMNIIINLTV